MPIIQSDDVKLPKRLNDYMETLFADTKVTEMNIREMGLALPGIRSKWIKFKYAEEQTLEKLENHVELLVEEYIAKHGHENAVKFKTKAEAEQSKQVLKTKTAILMQKDVVKFINDAINLNIKSISFDIKNCTELFKLEG